MINEKFKELTIKLSDELQNKCLKFILANVSEEEEAQNIINLILSANLSTIYTLMLMISSEHKLMHEKVKEFIRKLSEFIPTIIEGCTVETIHPKK